MVCKWKNKHRLIFNMISIFLPIFRDSYMLRARKAVAKSIRNCINEKNNQITHEKPYEFEVWNDPSFTVAQLIVKHRYEEYKEAQPIVIQISGNLYLDDPLTLHLNSTLIGSHLRMIFKHDPTMVTNMSKDIGSKLNKIKISLQGLYLLDNTIYFCYKLLNFLNLMEDLNQNTFKSVGLKANFVILEELKLKYQRAKYRYNQLYHVKSKSFDKIEELRKKLVEFDTLKDKFTYQYLIFLTPTFQNKKLTLLNSEIEEYTTKHAM